MRVLVVYESMSGNTYSFVNRVSRLYNCDIATPRNIHEYNLDDYNKILIGSPTYANGKMLPKIKNWVIDNRETLMTKDVLAFGSGITIYPHFCKAVDSISLILDDKVKEKIKFELTYNPSYEVVNEGKLYNFLKGDN